VPHPLVPTLDRLDNNLKSRLLLWPDHVQFDNQKGYQGMSVAPADVAKIASLARIKLTEAEIDAMVPELNGILAWVDQLGEVDVTGIEPMTIVIPNELRLRADVVGADPLTGGNIREQVLANAPAAEHGFFGVPKVIE